MDSVVACRERAYATAEDVAMTHYLHMSPTLTPHLVRRKRGLREGNEGRGALEWSIMVLLDAEEKGTIAVRVALFITCFNDTLFPETGQATVEVLERLGVEVDFPYAQTCCGQMHFNTGYQREAILLREHGPRALPDGR
jgi:Fe-S oxidoreductase